ncbi:MAG: hypothetical protein V3S55_06415 [Nitrospiraceae bacterium]
MRIGEYGFTIRINTGFDLSDNTVLTLNVTHPDSSKTTHPMTLGTVEVTADGLGIFQANEYVEYIVQANDYTQAGKHTLSVTADFGASQRLISVDATFNLDA